MPFAIDEVAINDSNLKVMDILKPSTKAIAFQEFPKMLYLHPKDKTKEQRTRIVKDATEQERAFKEGWRVQQHIPQEPTVDLAADFEAEMPEEAHTEPRRGPGRPPRAVEAA